MADFFNSRSRISRRPGSADGGALMGRAHIPDREIAPLPEPVRMDALRTLCRQAAGGKWPMSDVLDMAYMLGLAKEDDHGED